MKLSKKKLKTNQLFFDLSKVLEKNKKPFFLHEPFLDKTDTNSISKCVNSKFISTAGEYTKKFENELKNFIPDIMKEMTFEELMKVIPNYYQFCYTVNIEDNFLVNQFP